MARHPTRLVIPILLALSLAPGCASPRDPLPSWTDSGAKHSITAFVDRTTTPGSPHYVEPEDRIAVFDNDGTLWAEQPAYFQLAFAIDRIRAMAASHPEWQTQEPFASVLRGDLQSALAGGETAVKQIVAATHAGMTTDEFRAEVERWIATARHPKTDRLSTDMVYQPMLEVLDYLEDHGYTTYIVSGGGIEFMRPWTERTYGIPPQRVIGSSAAAKFEMRDTGPVLIKQPEIGSIDDGPGKPVNINLHIGRRPVIAFGNSDGDLQMLQWTDAHDPSLCVYIHHTDAAREWAYDRDSHIGRLDKGLDEAARRGWIVVDMRSDWKRIFPDATDHSSTP